MESDKKKIKVGLALGILLLWPRLKAASANEDPKAVHDRVDEALDDLIDMMKGMGIEMVLVDRTAPVN